MKFSLNTSTLRGHRLTLVEEIEIASQSGFKGIEPWIDELDRYVEEGGSLDDLRHRIADHGLTVENAIGFFAWIVDDADQRKAGLDEARRNMDLVAKIGGQRLAAPPFGATEQSNLSLIAAADRYRDLLAIGHDLGVTPLLELWGFSRTLSRLGEVAFVATECGRTDAELLLDVYHLYKGGSGIEGLAMLNGASIGLFHVNDYPAEPGRADIADADRVFPGDGVANLSLLMSLLRKIGYTGAVSLELFNPLYYARDARSVAQEGMEKMRRSLGHL